MGTNDRIEENPELADAERGIPDCPNIEKCRAKSACGIELSSIGPGDERRGHRDPRVLLVTEAPDKSSSEGSAYQGTISKRLLSLFCDEKYGIGLPQNTDTPFAEFLDANRFYATSAIKCYLDGSGTDAGNYVISKCRERFLDNQIEAMPNLELLIPMGEVATASILKRNLGSFHFTSLIGKWNEGILPAQGDSETSRVIFPHPSGSNPSANPPIIDANGNPGLWEYKMRFRKALRFVRDRLDELGYDVLKKSPSSWDRPPGLSDFE